MTDIGPVGAAFREHAGPIVVRLTRRYGDFAAAEDAVQTALVEALTRWPRDGLPRDPAAWLWTAAQRRLVDAIRADAARRTREQGWPTPYYDSSATDDRLALLFGCCHPELSSSARVALTLRAVCGLTTAQIARGLMLNEATLAQQIVRAKRTLSRDPRMLTIPERSARLARLTDVLTVIWLMFNEAYVTTSGRDQDREVAADALWLAQLVTVAFPDEPETWGLAALLTFHHARGSARFDDGELVLLAHQDRSQWDHDAIAAADVMLVRAAAAQRPGRFQLQAAIAACHMTAAAWEDTDWLQIVLLYDLLAVHDRSPVVVLNRAVARAFVAGPDAVLPDLEALKPELEGYYLFHAVHAEVLRMAQRWEEARFSDERALQLTHNDAEQRLLRTRLTQAEVTERS